MRVSLIITTYNRVDALSLVLRSVENQTVLPKEVIIADDGSGSDTKEAISVFQKTSNLNIIHSWQKDKGLEQPNQETKLSQNQRMITLF